MQEDILRNIWPEWHIVKTLGRGSYGVVYEAVRTDFSVESHAAIKVISVPQREEELDSLRSDGMSDEQSRTYLRALVDDFVREIELMKTLQGVQNVVVIEDYKVIESQTAIHWDIYVRMELLTPLIEYASRSPLGLLPQDEVIRLGSDICKALEYCERSHIIHRDIKPENIMVNDKFGIFKLGDFGVARQLESITMSLSVKGTPNYMAPEVYNRLKYDNRADLYSLGLVLYRFMNRNSLPFNEPGKKMLTPDERKASLFRRINGEALPVPVDASPELTDIILHACAFDPAMRFKTAREMRKALDGLLMDKTVTRVDYPRHERTDKTDKNDKTLPMNQPDQGGMNGGFASNDGESGETLPVNQPGQGGMNGGFAPNDGESGETLPVNQPDQGGMNGGFAPNDGESGETLPVNQPGQGGMNGGFAPNDGESGETLPVNQPGQGSMNGGFAPNDGESGETLPVNQPGQGSMNGGFAPIDGENGKTLPASPFGRSGEAGRTAENTELDKNDDNQKEKLRTPIDFSGLRGGKKDGEKEQPKRGGSIWDDGSLPGKPKHNDKPAPEKEKSSGKSIWDDGSGTLYSGKGTSPAGHGGSSGRGATKPGGKTGSKMDDFLKNDTPEETPSHHKKEKKPSKLPVLALVVLLLAGIGGGVAWLLSRGDSRPASGTGKRGPTATVVAEVTTTKSTATPTAARSSATPTPKPASTPEPSSYSPENWLYEWDGTGYCVKEYWGIASDVVIPDAISGRKVIRIGEYTFSKFKIGTSVTSIVIPDTISGIDAFAFALCTDLKSITIPRTVTWIGENAFTGTKLLTDVYYSGSQSDWQRISIDPKGNETLTSATIHYNAK